MVKSHDCQSCNSGSIPDDGVMKKIKWDSKGFRVLLPVIGEIFCNLTKESDGTFSVEFETPDVNEIIFGDSFHSIETVSEAKRLAEKEFKQVIKKLIKDLSVYA